MTANTLDQLNENYKIWEQELLKGLNISQDQMKKRRQIMSRVDENCKFINYIKKVAEDKPFEQRCMDSVYRPTVIGILLDISVSLAVIADSLEGKSNEKR